MNSLEVYIREQGLNPSEVMDTLQAHSLISDNCVTPADVFGADNFRAIVFLDKTKTQKKK